MTEDNGRRTFLKRIASVAGLAGIAGALGGYGLGRSQALLSGDPGETVISGSGVETDLYEGALSVPMTKWSSQHSYDFIAYLIDSLSFDSILREPDSLVDGNWVGRGDIVWVEDDGYYYHTSTTRDPTNRGYEIEIYRSTDGKTIGTPIDEIAKNDVVSGADSLQETKFLKDQISGNYYIFVAVDVGTATWRIVVLEASDPTGPWSNVATVTQDNEDGVFDSQTAKDPKVLRWGGRYICAYNAYDGSVNTQGVKMSDSADPTDWDYPNAAKALEMQIDGQAFNSTNYPDLRPQSRPVVGSLGMLWTTQDLSSSKEVVHIMSQFRNIELTYLGNIPWTQKNATYEQDPTTARVFKYPGTFMFDYKQRKFRYYATPYDPIVTNACRLALYETDLI